MQSYIYSIYEYLRKELPIMQSNIWRNCISICNPKSANSQRPFASHGIGGNDNDDDDFTILHIRKT